MAAEAKSGLEPRIEKLADSVYLVIIPYRVGTQHFVGFGEIRSTDDRFLFPLAQAVQVEMGQSREIGQLCDQSSQLSQFADRDFERLAFLRRMADCMELSNDQDLPELMAQFLPILRTSIECDWIAIVAGADFGFRRDYACDGRYRVLGVGERQMPDSRLIELIGEFGFQAVAQSLVRNDLDPDAFPHLRQLVLTRIHKRRRHWGWLVAGNGPIAQGASAGNSSVGSRRQFGGVEAALLQSAGVLLATHAHNVELVDQQGDLMVSTVRTLVTTLEAKDEYTWGHSERVATYGRLISEELGLSAADTDRVYLTGLLHDVGKVGVPDAILQKPGALTSEEFRQIKQHPEIGWQMLQGLAPLTGVLNGVLHHHERMDGGGYPDGLEGEDIPFDGRILAVADAYDAMTSPRSFRSSLDQPQAETVLRNGAGVQWDANVISAMFRAMPHIARVRQTQRQHSLRISRRSRAPRR